MNVFLLRSSSYFFILIFFSMLSYLYVDQSIINLVTTLSPDLIDFFNWITIVGDGKIIILCILSTLIFRYLYIKPRWAAYGWFLTLCICTSGVICNILKMLFGRARPELWLTDHQYGFFWLKNTSPYWSFPSGHTTVIMSLAFGLSILFPRHKILFIIASTVVTFSRVVVMKHYVSDVLVAMYLAYFEVMILAHLFRNKLSNF
jgi:membrane-associated phospholipid phosphatase